MIWLGVRNQPGTKLFDAEAILLLMSVTERYGKGERT